jgi:hypothetical protein
MESHEDGWMERALMFGDDANGAATQIRIIAKRTKDTGIVQIHLSAAEGDHGSEVDGSPHRRHLGGSGTITEVTRTVSVWERWILAGKSSITEVRPC